MPKKKVKKKPPPTKEPSLPRPLARPFVPAGSKERIMLAALELLRDKGFDGFSASEISRLSGMSKATLFHHFRTMDEIPLASLELVRDFIRPEIDSSRYGSLREFLLAYGEESISFRAEKSFFRMMHFYGGRSMAQPEYEAAIKRLVGDYVQWLADVMARFLPKATPRVDIEEMATLVTIVLEGLASHRALHGDPTRLPGLWSTTVELVAQRLNSRA